MKITHSCSTGFSESRCHIHKFLEHIFFVNCQRSFFNFGTSRLVIKVTHKNPKSTSLSADKSRPPQPPPESTADDYADVEADIKDDDNGIEAAEVDEDADPDELLGW